MFSCKSRLYQRMCLFWNRTRGEGIETTSPLNYVVENYKHFTDPWRLVPLCYSGGSHEIPLLMSCFYFFSFYRFELKVLPLIFCFTMKLVKNKYDSLRRER